MKQTSNEEYLRSQKERAVEIARQIVQGEMSIIEGSRFLSSIANEIDPSHDDDDFKTFIGIDSETDHLPIGTVRQLWNKEALEKKDKEIDKAEHWASEFGLEACKNIIKKLTSA